jgi:hypothetical protein
MDSKTRALSRQVNLSIILSFGQMCKLLQHQSHGGSDANSGCIENQSDLSTRRDCCAGIRGDLPRFGELLVPASIEP